jgi:hypothetical protein
MDLDSGRFAKELVVGSFICIRKPSSSAHVIDQNEIVIEREAARGNYATDPVRHCSPGCRFADRLPFKSHSAPRPPQTSSASS